MTDENFMAWLLVFQYVLLIAMYFSWKLHLRLIQDILDTNLRPANILLKAVNKTLTEEDHAD
jgi:hypothetical protein